MSHTQPDVRDVSAATAAGAIGFGQNKGAFDPQGIVGLRIDLQVGAGDTGFNHGTLLCLGIGEPRVGTKCHPPSPRLML